MLSLRYLVVAVFALLLVASATGCGGEDDAQEQPPAATTEAGTEPEGETDAEGEASAGGQVFRQNCAGCHTLDAAGTTGTVGPNLDELDPSAERVEEQVREGVAGCPRSRAA